VEPLLPGASWLYDIVEDGKKTTETQTVSRRATTFKGKQVYETTSKRPGEDKDVDVEGIGPHGESILYQVKDEDGPMTFDPPIATPAAMKVGQHVHLQGKVVAYLDSYRLTGTYSIDIDALRTQRVTVRAGTFRTLKLRAALAVSLSHHGSGLDLVMTATGTDTDWVAKGVGSVKGISTFHAEADGNGRHFEEESVETQALRSFDIPATRARAARPMFSAVEIPLGVF
jgi:hypothetical protein